MRHLVFFSWILFALSASAQQVDPAGIDEAAEPEPLPEIVGEGDVETTDPAPAETTEPDEWLRRPGYDTVICPFRGRIDYEPGEIGCGLIKVPENREVPGSRTIELHFVRLRTRGEDHEGNEVEVRDDPVIYLTGGPGVTVESYVRRLKDHRLLARRDLYILEQRGIGNSGEFCPFFSDRNRVEQVRETFEGQERAFIRAARTCIETARAKGVDVTGYHTFENARDVRALRLALGLADWNVWGISYGSVLGQAYMKVDPEGIRATVIDAIVPLDLHELMRLPHWHERNLDRLFTACAGQPACADQYGDLRERYMAAIADMTEQPVVLEVPESERYPTGEAYLFQDLVAGLPFGLLYEQSSHPAIPAVIAGLTRAVEVRDQTFFRALALAEGLGGGVGVSMGMSIAVRCQDGYVDRQAESAPADFEDYPTLARAFGTLEVIQEGPEACREIGLNPRDPETFELVQTELPVVVANGAWDPITPTPLAEYIMSGFVNGRLVEFPHAGHGPTRSLDCAGEFLNGFYDDPDAELDMSCVEEGESAAEYIAPYFATRAVPRGIIMEAEAATRFRVHVIWGAVSIFLTLLGFVTLLLGWLARRLDGHGLPPAGGTRGIVFLSAFAGTAWAAGVGVAAKVTSDITEAMLLFGLVPWAGWVAWLVPAAGLLGLLGLVQIWRYRGSLYRASRVGLILPALGGVSLSVFALVWDLWPI